MSRCGQLASTFQARVSVCKGVRGPGACSCWTQPDLADMHMEIRNCSYKVSSKVRSSLSSFPANLGVCAEDEDGFQEVYSVLRSVQEV